MGNISYWLELLTLTSDLQFFPKLLIEFYLFENLDNASLP